MAMSLSSQDEELSLRLSEGVMFYDIMLFIIRLLIGDWCKSDTGGFDPLVSWAVQLSPTKHLYR